MSSDNSKLWSQFWQRYTFAPWIGHKLLVPEDFLEDHTHSIQSKERHLTQLQVCYIVFPSKISLASNSLFAVTTRHYIVHLSLDNSTQSCLTCCP
jgi:hypothetical protein